jgi:hypothetical protein
VLTLPAGNAPALQLLVRSGFVETERLLHMQRGGGADPRRLQDLYAQASLALG